MQKLADIKQVAGDAGQEMPHLLVIIECKCQLLIMPEDIPAHICLHLCTHDMPEIRNIKIAEDLKQHQGRHHSSEHHEGLPRSRSLKVHNLVRDIPYNQRDDQHHCRPKDCKEHITVE